ncbi:peptidase M1 [Myxococcus stipitatus]|uniref:M1 family metallopeptidase n=1 Tax=Myxococcus stipitatus TaxID=83455 RepID=UPI001F324239|nr:M1 family aminopeptidase [Myxococcus stipitatus]MCE9670562.1 peptidase M1 [Myxococcus stipitatus]
MNVVTRKAIALLSLTGLWACGPTLDSEPTPAPEMETLGQTQESLSCASLGESTQLNACPELCALVNHLPLPQPRASLSRNILTTSLDVKLDTLSATAAIQVAPSLATGLSLKVGKIQVTGVRSRCGALNYTVQDGQLDIGMPIWASTVLIDYTFEETPDFDGYMPTGSTFLWPSFCANLFPCHPALADGVKFSLKVSNAPAGKTVVYPTRIPADAPAYMLAWAVGDYTEIPLGSTTAGTQVSVWHLPGEAEVATAGTLHLKDAVDFFERQYGAYTFGGKVGSVSANWGPGAYGGMEHHPYWHVASDAMDDKLVHQHEAAHGWYGNGVRIQCWEDFVLSEGTAEYLTARSVRATEGADAEAAVWTQWRAELERAVSRGDTYALPDSTCNAIDILTHPLWSNIPYKKGAFFYRALEQQIGTEAIDRVLARFYRQHVGRTARMQQFLDLVKAETGQDPTALANAWLRGLGIPAATP